MGFATSNAIITTVSSVMRWTNSQTDAETELRPLVRRNVAPSAMVQTARFSLAVFGSRQEMVRSGTSQCHAPDMQTMESVESYARGILRTQFVVLISLVGRLLSAMPGRPLVCKYKQSYTLRTLYNSTQEQYASVSTQRYPL